MNINKETVRYITRAIEEIDAWNPLLAEYLGNYCPECDENINGIDTSEGEHILYNGNLLIGCEGFYKVNPNLLGMHFPNWCDFSR